MRTVKMELATVHNQRPERKRARMTVSMGVGLLVLVRVAPQEVVLRHDNGVMVCPVQAHKILDQNAETTLEKDDSSNAENVDKIKKKKKTESITISTFTETTTTIVTRRVIPLSARRKRTPKKNVSVL